MPKHTLKLEYNDGEKLPKPISWCGKEMNSFDWCFQDAQHLALSSQGSIVPCKNCIRAIIKELQKEL
jgi:hypothetical protein